MKTLTTGRQVHFEQRDAYIVVEFHYEFEQRWHKARVGILNISKTPVILDETDKAAPQEAIKATAMKLLAKTTKAAAKPRKSRGVTF